MQALHAISLGLSEIGNANVEMTRRRTVHRAWILDRRAAGVWLGDITVARTDTGGVLVENFCCCRAGCCFCCDGG